WMLRTSKFQANDEPARCSHTDMYNYTRQYRSNRVLTGQVQSTPVTCQLDVHTRICTTIPDNFGATTSSQDKYSPRQ
ncbi:hypothetical protein J6590_045240, partial [Homalodisca vitripennis]